jgi:glycosyltransferase involved in cell wall biosynthesis
MRLLIVTGIFPPDIGGPATYVLQLARALATRGHQVTVLTLSDRLDHDDGRYPFAVVRLPRQLCKPWRWPRTIRQIVRLGQQADLLFVNGLFLEAALANRWLRKPLVMKVVGDVAWEQATNRGWVRDSFEAFQQRRYGLKVEALKALRTWWTRQADRLIVPSRYLARWVAAWGIPEDTIAVIYNAIPPYRPSPPVGEGRGEGEACVDALSPPPLPISTPLKLVTVGRLVPWKRIDKVIEAVASCDGVGLVIVGDGPERGRLEHLAQACGLADRVYLAGRCSHAETLALMAACDLFILNSTYEGLPHAVLEALALGLPVVATAAGGTPELVQDGVNGRLIPPDAPGVLAEMLAKLAASPPERQRLAVGARGTAARFTLEALVAQTEALLQSVIRVSRNGVGDGAESPPAGAGDRDAAML